MEQMSLVIFTLLAQCAAGLFLTVGLTQLFARSDLHAPQIRLLNRGYMVTLVVLAVAMIASMSHLGQPLRAMNVAYGLLHGSPLTLEIVTISAFSGVVFLLTAMQMRTLKRTALQQVFLVSGLLLGLALVQAIANVYTLPSIPAWDNAATPLQLFQSMLATGSTLGAIVLLGEHGYMERLKGSATIVARRLGLLAIVMVIAVSLLFLQQLVSAGVISSWVDEAAFLVYLRAVLVVIGLSIWVAPALRGGRVQGRAGAGMLLVLAGELFGRIYFYDLLQTMTM